MENRSAPQPTPRRARLGAACLAALGVGLFGLATLPAEEASAAGIVGGIHYLSPEAPVVKAEGIGED